MNIQGDNKREHKETTNEIRQSAQDKETSNDGLRNEINDDDDRDHGDSTQDWEAENSRTGRHK